LQFHAAVEAQRDGYYGDDAQRDGHGEADLRSGREYRHGVTTQFFSFRFVRWRRSMGGVCEKTVRGAPREIFRRFPTL